MAAVDIIITLAIIIKIIDIFVISYKKKNKEKAIRPDTKKPNRIPIIIMTIIIIMLIGVSAKNQKIEVNPKQEQQVSKIEQPNANSYPAGIYMQPLLSVTTGIMNQMGERMIENTKRVQQKARQDVLLSNPAYKSEIVRQNSEKAVIQARTETQSFDSIYKKPTECYDTRNSATRIKCANEYMRARAAFGKN